MNGVSFEKSASATSWSGLAQRRSTKSPGGVHTAAAGSAHAPGRCAGEAAAGSALADRRAVAGGGVGRGGRRRGQPGPRLEEPSRRSKAARARARGGRDETKACKTIACIARRRMPLFADAEQQQHGDDPGTGRGARPAPGASRRAGSNWRESLSSVQARAGAGANGATSPFEAYAQGRAPDPSGDGREAHRLVQLPEAASARRPGARRTSGSDPQLPRRRLPPSGRGERGRQAARPWRRFGEDGVLDDAAPAANHHAACGDVDVLPDRRCAAKGPRCRRVEERRQAIAGDPRRDARRAPKAGRRGRRRSGSSAPGHRRGRRGRIRRDSLSGRAFSVGVGSRS